MRRSRALAILWLSIASFFLATLLWLASDRAAAQKSHPAYSTFNTGDQGLSIAYRYLSARRGAGSVGQLTRVVDPTEVAPDAVILRINPLVLPFLEPMEEEEANEEEETEKKKEKKKADPKGKKRDAKKSIKKAPPVRRVFSLLTPEEEEWVSAGGRLVLAIDRTYGPLAVGAAPADGEVTKVFPIWKSVPSFNPPQRRVLGPLPTRRGTTLFAIGSGAAIARVRIGAGEVFLMSIPEIFSNRELANPAHLAVLQEVTSGRRVLFDEASHGIRTDAGLLELLRRWNLGPFLMLLALTFVISSWRKATRVGAPDDNFVDTRSEAIDLVDSLGQLYDRVLTRGEALRLYYRSLERAVAQQTGLRDDPLTEKVNQLTGGFKPSATEDHPSTARFKKHLQAINEGFGRLQNARHR